MAKKKKSKPQVKKSESSLIKERARKLPLNKCYINQGWEEAGMATVMVTRKHVNGNLTVGHFQVDTFLKGVKDCFGRFNIPPFEFEETIENMEGMGAKVVEIDYNNAHNIIYGAIEYAEDFEYFPHKEWNTVRYILEEDTDDIPLIDIEFGFKGKPTLFANANQAKKDITKLTALVGDDGFNYIAEDGYDPDYDDFDYDDEIDEEVSLVKETIDEDFEQLVESKYMNKEQSIGDAIKKMEANKDDEALSALIDKLYFEAIGHNAFSEIDLVDYVIGEREMTIADLGSWAEKLENDPSLIKNTVKLYEFYNENPDSYMAIYLYFMALFNKEPMISVNEIIELAQQVLKNHPDSDAALSNYLLWLIYSNDLDRFDKELKETDFINKILKNTASIDTVGFCYFCMIRSFEYLNQDELQEADRYYMAYKLVNALDIHPLFIILSQKVGVKKSLFLNELSILLDDEEQSDNLIKHDFRK